MINSITLVSATFDQLGMTFDPAIALLNHSCNPNAAIVFDQNVACIRSIKDLKKGEQVTISYIDNTYKRATRRSQLREQYYFDCHCEGCEPKDNLFTGRDSWTCENEQCKGLIPEPLLKGDFTCWKCQSSQTQSLDTLRNLETKAFTVLETTSNSPGNIASLLNNILLPTLAALTSNPSWPPIRQPAPALRRQIYHLCLNSENYEAAYHHSNTLSSSPLSNIHPEPYHPLKTVQLFTTASLIALLASKENSVDYLKRAWELLRLTWELCRGSHGETSEFAKRVAAKRGEVEMDLSLGGEEIRRWMRMHH
jgi:SET and MYND domain-containing protein